MTAFVNHDEMPFTGTAIYAASKVTVTQVDKLESGIRKGCINLPHYNSQVLI